MVRRCGLLPTTAKNFGTNGDAAPLNEEKAFAALASPAAKDLRSAIRFDHAAPFAFKKIIRS